LFTSRDVLTQSTNAQRRAMSSRSEHDPCLARGTAHQRGGWCGRLPTGSMARCLGFRDG
jgi:hypothetical protein